MSFRWNSRNVAASIVVFVFTCYVPIAVQSQVAGATLSGTVNDSSGAAVSNANISVRNTETGVSRDVTTDSVGFYNVPNLSPGTYEVTATSQGFSKLVRSGVTLTVGAQQALNLSLQVGQVTQTVEVTAQAPTVELTSSAITAEVDSTTVRELPLNGRDWSSLATLQPGIIAIRTQASTIGTSSRGNRGFGNQLTVAGHSPYENNYRVNGISVNDYTNGSPGSVLGAQLGVDAIQEFSVLTSNYSAEYGRTSGGVINAVTKPGTNAFHGSAYWFLRDGKLDATSFFANTNSFHRNQFGASAGGPIQKDKTFWFADYEGIRQDKGLNASKLIVPSMAVRQGTLCSQPSLAPSNAPCTTHQVTGAFNPDPLTGIDKSVEPYLPLWPTANGGPVPGGGGDTGYFISSPTQQNSENFTTSRVDHKFSEKDGIDVVMLFDRSPGIAPDGFLESTVETFSQRWMGGIEETHVFSPRLVNTFRVGYNRTTGLVNQPLSALQPIAADTTLGIFLGQPAPTLTVGGITTAQGVLGSAIPFGFFENSYQIYDDAFLTRGAHALKFGGSVERIEYDRTSISMHAGSNGNFGFGSLLGFLQNVPISAGRQVASTISEIGGRQSLFGLYFQDDWHARTDLTINLGVRYEPTTLPTEVHGLSTILTNIYGGLPVTQAHAWQSNQTLKNFEPRVGFAWDPFHDGKTSVRAGFGVFDVLPGPWEWVYPQQEVPPFTGIISITNVVAGDFPTNGAAKIAAINPSLAGGFAPDQFPKNNYAMNWNLNIQRQITSTLTATIAYVGSRTVHSPFQSGNTDIVAPTTVAGLGVANVWPCGPPLDSSGRCTTGHGTVIDPNVTQIKPIFWAVGAHYSALQAGITKRMSHGFQFQGSYTWSKCLDNGDNSGLGDPYLNSFSNPVFYEGLQSAAPCDFEVPQNFVGNWIWDVPAPKSTSAIVTHLAGGWELGGIVTVSTGSPFSVILGGDPLGQKLTGEDFASRFAGCNPVNSNYKMTMQYLNLSCFTPPVAPASFVSQCANFPNAATPPPTGMVYCANLFGTAGRNALIGPGLVNLDFSVFKNNYVPQISESFNVQFRAEFFNVMNHPNFQSPVNNDTLFNANGSPVGGAGTISSVVTDPREIQFSLKVIW